MVAGQPCLENSGGEEDRGNQKGKSKARSIRGNSTEDASTEQPQQLKQGAYKENSAEDTPARQLQGNSTEDALTKQLQQSRRETP